MSWYDDGKLLSNLVAYCWTFYAKYTTSMLLAMAPRLAPMVAETVTASNLPARAPHHCCPCISDVESAASAHGCETPDHTLRHTTKVSRQAASHQHEHDVSVPCIVQSWAAGDLSTVVTTTCLLWHMCCLCESATLTHDVVAQANCDARVLLQLLQCAVEAGLIRGLQDEVGHKVVHKEAQHLAHGATVTQRDKQTTSAHLTCVQHICLAKLVALNST